MNGRVSDSEIWFDGRLVAASEPVLSLDDETVQTGLGVFETLAVREGFPLDLSEHLDRLGRGAEQVGITIQAPGEITAALREMARRIEGGHGWLKVVVTVSGHRAVLGGPSDAGEEGKPATAVLLPWTRNPRDVLAGLKTLNYAFSSLGLREARVRGTDEGLWRNTRGFLVEGSASNLFVVRGGRIFTPALGEGLLPGVTRRFAIEAASRLGYPLHQGKVRVQRLARADEAFLTSSLKGVRPLVRFEGEPIGTGEPGPVTLEIAREVASIRRERAAVERSRG